ncbi:MAG TPA: hypothetical protein VK886_01000 [Vicinamibacterales bacterium]|nr:hypothetical protein [Vicinamibacterales bacterium]
MFNIWVVAAGAVACAAALVVLRVRRRRARETEFTTEPLSGQWLAEARTHEDQPW